MKEKITEITPEQTAQIPDHVKHWVDVGVNTERLDPANTKSIIDDYRKILSMKTDVPLVILNNPLECWVACTLVLNYDVLVKDLHEEIAGVFNGNPKKYQIESASLPWQSGSFFVSTFSFYDFIINKLSSPIDKELKDKYDIWQKTSELGCIYPLDEITIVSEKPTEVFLNDTNVLHKDGGPALTYAGFGDIMIFSLNGVRVPEYLAVTDAEALDLEYYKTITNADVKAEFVRKVGIERFLDHGKLIDSYEEYQGDHYKMWHSSEYQLWDMSFLFAGLSYAPYLYMKNATTKIFHLEGVSPACRDLKAALKERFKGRDFVIKAIA